MFQRILVANRGEIALRVIRACKELDIEVVAVYSQADRDAAYLAQADRAICIGKGQSSDSYLNRSRIIAAAEVADAQAIHPGYGFLSENPDFAEVCRLERLRVHRASARGDPEDGPENRGQEIAAAAKVACVPGSDGVIANEAQAISLARSIGYPVLIKAAAGGGGKGMRVCRDESNLATALQTASNEAEAAFKNASIYLEKFIDRPAPRRGADPGRFARRDRLLLGPRLHLAAPASEARRGIACSDLAGQGAHPDVRSGRSARENRRLRERRHM